MKLKNRKDENSIEQSQSSHQIQHKYQKIKTTKKDILSKNEQKPSYRTS